MLSRGKFQSLVGFKINWNRGNYSGFYSYTKFQSLVGFKINWNFKASVWDGCHFFVSIPNRV